MQFLFVTPITRQAIDSVQDGVAIYTGVAVRHIAMDLDAGTVTVTVSPIEAQGPLIRPIQVVLMLTPTQVTNFTAALKTALAAKYGVTFQ